MPAYNAEKYVKQAIDSILSQSYSNIELIIADDSSKDKTKTIIDSYNDPRIHTYHNAQNMGYLKTWNKLMQLTKGKYITFQDADDTSDPERIYKMATEFKQDPTLGVCGSNYISVDEDGIEKTRSDIGLTHSEIFNSMPDKYHFIGSGVMIRSDVFQNIGGYDMFFDRMGGEDHYWIYRILEKYKMKNIPDHLYFYRYNPDSVMGDLTTNSKKLFNSDILKLLISQRKQTGTDDLEKGNQSILAEKLKEMIAPYEKDKALLFHKVAKQRYYEGHKRQSLNILIKAIAIAPFRFKYYRDLIYFLKN